MQHAPDDAGRDAEVSLDGNARSRTAAAGLNLLKAIGGDLIALASGFGRIVPPLRKMPPDVPGATSSRLHAAGRVFRRVCLAAAVTYGVTVAVTFAAMLWALHGLPLHRPLNAPRHPTLFLEAADGTSLGRFGPFRMAPLALKDYPPILIKAVLSTEDRRFYQNPGFDPEGIIRAARRNFEAGRIVEGGSTITQQLVKLEYLGEDRTYLQKLREAIVAFWLDARLSKDAILTRYLNSVYLGSGAYGMAAAARLYFNRRPADLTLPEAAMLAGMIKGPSEFDPLHHLEAARRRADTVLDGMVANGVISAGAANDAKNNPAQMNSAPHVGTAKSWFTDWVGPLAAKEIGPSAGPVRVRTTLRPDLQRLAQNILDTTLANEGRRRGVTEGAMVVMRPDGAVLAMVGGRNYGASQFNRAVDAERQPGSAFKLFVYLAALRDGFLPDDSVYAGPIDVRGWEPANYARERFGRITLEYAFAHSVNTAAVRLAMDVGVTKVIAAARDLGIDTPLPRVPSLALGSAGVNLLELTSAYAAVRADRMPVHPWGVAAVGQSDGSLRPFNHPRATRTLDPYQAPLLELLRGVVEHGTGRAAALDGFAAGKTGTTNDYRDAWFLGFDNQLIVGVWVGNDNDAPMKRVVGGSLPADIWRAFMTQAAPVVGPAPLSSPSAPVVASTNNPQTTGLAPPAGRPASDQTTQAQQMPGGGRCNIPACAQNYRSFRASDCTYQPYVGPRRVCSIGQTARLSSGF